MNIINKILNHDICNIINGYLIVVNNNDTINQLKDINKMYYKNHHHYTIQNLKNYFVTLYYYNKIYIWNKLL